MDDRVPKIDETRSFHGWATTVTVFAALIALAVAAWVLEPDYMAHVPVTVGVSALDSIHSHSTLEAFADLIREKGGGDVTWRYLAGGDAPAGCDFYLLTPLQLAAHAGERSPEISLLATGEGGRRRSRGVVFAKKGASGPPASLFFPDRWSCAGFLSSWYALLESGSAPSGGLDAADFAGCAGCGEQVLYGVVFGGYEAGGLSSDVLERLLRQHPGLSDSVRVLLTGPPVAELVLAADPSVEGWKRQGFLSRLPLITADADGLLREGLRDIGMDGFVQPEASDPDFFTGLPDSLITHVLDYRP